MLGWLDRLWAELLRPPAIRPLTEEEREVIRAEYRARMGANGRDMGAVPLSALRWDQWLAQSAERQAGAGR